MGVGTDGMAPYPAVDMWGNTVYQKMKVDIDESTLREIASMTGGEYFRATDERKLSEIYDRINRLERTKIETTEYTLYHELFGRYLLWAVVLLAAELILRKLWLKQLP